MKKTLVLLLALVMISQTALCAPYAAFPHGDGSIGITGTKNPDTETTFLITDGNGVILDVAQVGAGEGDFDITMYVTDSPDNLSYTIDIGSHEIEFTNADEIQALADLNAASSEEFGSIIATYNRIFNADLAIIEPVCDKAAAYELLAAHTFATTNDVAPDYADILMVYIQDEITSALALVAEGKAGEAVSKYIGHFAVDVAEYNKIVSKNLVYDYLNGNTYTKSEFEAAFDDAVILAKINEASGEAFVSLVRTHQAKIGMDLSESANIAQKVFDKVDARTSLSFAALATAFVEEISLYKLNTATVSNVRSVLENENAVLGILDTAGYSSLSEDLKNSVCEAMARANEFATIEAAKDEFALLIGRANTPGATIDPTPAPSGGGNFSVGGGVSQAPSSPTALPFADVRADYWGYEAINALYKQKVVSGVSADSYEPERLVMREEFIKMLVGTFGLYKTDATNVFADISSDDWCAPYVASAYACGLTTGMGNGTFGKGQTLTRQDMATLAARCASLAGLELQAQSQTDFADSSAIADYALDGVYALSGAGVINGMGDGTFSPYSGCTRAMAAKVCYELLKIYKGGDI